MKKFLLLGLLPFAAQAAPFLTCDPYPTDVAEQAIPTEFVVTVSGLATPIVTPAVAVTGGVAMRLDLGPLNLSGAKTLTAKARNAWGESANSAPFAFTAGSPATPSGFGLSAN